MAYKSDQQLAKKIYRMKTQGRAMEMPQALSLCDKFLSAWLQISAPSYKWFEVDGGEYELYIETAARGDFQGRIHARKTV